MRTSGIKRIITWVLLFVFLLSCFSFSESWAATTTGTVKTDGLNVRTGAGTSFARLEVEGTAVQLNTGTIVTILETLTGWYRISFTYNNTTLEGYVSSDYITLNGTTIPVPIVSYKYVTTYKPIEAKGTIISKTYMRKTAAGRYYRASGKKVALKAGRNVTVLGQEKKHGVDWYKLKFFYKKKNRVGYLPASCVKLTCKTPVAAQIYNVKSSLAVRSKASTKRSIYYKINQKKVRVKKGQDIKVIKEKTVKGTKWFRISFTYQNKTRKGYVRARYVKLVKEKVVTKKAVTAMSDAEFEKYLTQQNFPESYKPGLRNLHRIYPYWQFTAYHTSMSWQSALTGESRELGNNLLPVTYGTDWKSQETGAYDPISGAYTVFDGSTWVAASKKAIAYYMDPRNFLTEQGIFQFELLEYQPTYQIASGVEGILKETPFRAGKTFSYTENGQTKSITYINAFIEAAKASGVSPYHLASRVRQEVVTGPDTTTIAVTGTTSGYPGIFNFYNIGAVSGKNPALNGLLFAKGGTANQTTYMRPWDDRYKAILGGASYIGSNYINRGQNTGYLQKFNVTAKNTYTHQYMTNVQAAYSESISTKRAYGTSLDATPLVFSIPVYSGMPASNCPKPSGYGYY